MGGTPTRYDTIDVLACANKLTICTENPTGVIVREGRLEGAGETVVGRICETGGFLSQK